MAEEPSARRAGRRTAACRAPRGAHCLLLPPATVWPSLPGRWLAGRIGRL